jgi:hypothetical protein
MRTLVAAIALCATLSAPSAFAQQSPGWSYAYADGVATATQRDDRGRTTATFACRPPTGDIVLTDFTFGRAARRVTTAAVRIGNLSVNVPATVEGRGRNAKVVVNLPQRPPILAGVQEQDVVAVTVNGQTNTYLRGSAMQMKDVAYACWGS